MEGYPKISELFPRIFLVSKPIVQGSTPLIVSGSLLHLQGVQMLPIVETLEPRTDPEIGKVYGALAGYSVLQSIVQSDPKDYSKLLWMSSDKFPVWIGANEFSDTVDKTLKSFDLTKFGAVAIDAPSGSRFNALLTLSEMISLFQSKVARSSLRASDICSDAISVPEDTSLIEALRVMFEKRIRHIFLGKVEYITGRDIIRFLFTPQRLEVAKNSPEKWLDAEISAIEKHKAKEVSPGRTVNQISMEFGSHLADDCLVISGKKVITRWDVVMKPWKSGDLRFLSLKEILSM